MVGLATENAVLVINGMEYSGWESVAVKHSHRTSPYFSFRVTCSEEAPIPTDWWALRIRVGDTCKIYLAGIPAFTGVVSTRQVYYSGRHHYVEIQGSSWAGHLAVTSPAHKTGEMKNVTFEQIVRALIAPYPFKFIKEGNVPLPTDKFHRVSIPHGVSTHDIFDYYSRPIGSPPFTSDVNGNFVVKTAPDSHSDHLYEGQQILEGREILYNKTYANDGRYAGDGQESGTDKRSGPEVSHIPFFQQSMINFSPIGYGPISIPMDLAFAKPEFLRRRLEMESVLNRDDEITVTVTVQGWRRPDGGLWDRGQTMYIHSPMLLMDGTVPLTLYTVVFAQDLRRGTTTTLECKNQLAMGGYRGGQ